MKLTPEEHLERHKKLHRAFDELYADYITNHPDEHNFTGMPVMKLIDWSHRQTLGPDHDP